MAKLALIYGMRLLPEEDLGEIKDATVVLKNGKTARVTMHLIEGTKEDPWELTTPPGSSKFQMYRDPSSDPPSLVCQVGSTTLRYNAADFIGIIWGSSLEQPQ